MSAQAFISWFQQAAPAERQSAVTQLAAAYGSGQLDSMAHIDAEMVIILMLESADQHLKAVIANAVCDKLAVDHSIIRKLASDADMVADAIVAKSPLLNDKLLQELFMQRSTRIRTAIAARRKLSPHLSRLVGENGDAAACRALLRNRTAYIDQETLRVIAINHLDDREITKELERRPDLNIVLRQMLISHLCKTWCENIGPDAPDLSIMRIHEARDRATLSLTEKAEDVHLEELTIHLRNTNQLTPSLILRTACQAQVGFLAFIASNLSDLPHNKVSEILLQGRSKHRRGLWRRIGLNSAVICALEALMEVLNTIPQENKMPHRQDFFALLAERTIACCRDADLPGIDSVLAFLQRIHFDQVRQTNGGPGPFGLSIAA